MSWEIIFVFAVLLFAIYSFVREKLPPDLTAITVFSVLLGTAALIPNSELPRVEDLLGVFANSAPLTVACMFILSTGLERCGVIDAMTGFLKKTTVLGYRGFLLAMMIPVGLVSAFINNTPVVIILLPVMLSLSSSLGVKSSKLLIPLSYASIFGGTCTLMGTSTNILGSELLAGSGQAPLSMFELSVVALPLAFIGGLYLFLFGNKLLPDRETLGAMIPEDSRKEFLAEAYVRSDSPLVGKKVNETRILKQSGFRLIEIIRAGAPLITDLKEVELQGGDRVLLACRPSGIAEAREFEGIVLEAERMADLEPIASREASIIEAMVAPNTPIIGRSVQDINFRQRFRTLVLAIHREGKNLREGLLTSPLRAGDTLLLLGPDESLEALRESRDLILLDRPRQPAESRRSKAPIAVGVLATVVALATFNVVPIVVATVLGVAVLFLTGCLKPVEGYRAIEWKILLLIYGMMGLGVAMQETGASEWIAMSVVNSLSTWVTPEWQPIILLLIVYLFSSAFTEFLSNNATIVLMVPIIISLAATMGIDARPLVIACCIGSSASFATPIGYQTNTLVYGVGAYRFIDFIKIGLPLNIIYAIGTVLIVPLFWDF